MGWHVALCTVVIDDIIWHHIRGGFYDITCQHMSSLYYTRILWDGM